MVARITTPNNIVRALNYNEQKVQKGQAELLHAANYLKDTNELKFIDQLLSGLTEFYLAFSS